MTAEPAGLSASPHWPYLASAAVLSSFRAEELRPFDGADTDLVAVGQMLKHYGESIQAGPARGRWQLCSSARRAALAELVKRGKEFVRDVVAAQERPDDPTQRALIDLIENGRPRNLRHRSFQDLLGLERALDWLDPVLPTAGISRADLMMQLERLRLLEPLQRLLANGFEGRQSELRTLRSYVDYLPATSFVESLFRNANWLFDFFRERPPLLIYGPGGIGKSTLLAKFILDHAGPDQAYPLPFIYLDFGNSTLDPRMPDTLLLEAARQIRAQHPAVADEAAAVAAKIENVLEGGPRDSASAKSLHHAQSSSALESLVRVLNALASSAGKNVLLVLDTFELVQRRGSTAVYNLLTLSADLLARVHRLRIVISGRAPLQREEFLDFTPKEPPWQPLPLDGFDAEAGRAYLRSRMRRMNLSDVPDATIDEIVRLARGNPLSLRLAAQLFERLGMSALKDAVAHAELQAAYSNELLQGMLHARIVETLPTSLQKIADPGLVVRLITPGVIRDVLAGSCGLTLNEPEDADRLFEEFRNELALVERTPEGALRHRPDVRLLMLPLLREKLGPDAETIDRAAAQYWQRQAGDLARVEELYHRLWLNEGEGSLDACWNRLSKAADLTGIRPSLDDALDELNALDTEPAPRIWLHRRLNRDFPASLRDRADQLAWERDAEKRARTLLERGAAGEALRLIHGREDWRPGSQLWLCEQEALQMLGQDEEALKRIDAALAGATTGATASLVQALMVHRATLFERRDDYETALAAADDADRLARWMKRKGLIFAAGITRLRLLRKLNRSAEREPVIEKMRSMLEDPAVKDAMQHRSTLLVEAAAELGSGAPPLLEAASGVLFPGKPIGESEVVAVRNSVDRLIKQTLL